MYEIYHNDQLIATASSRQDVYAIVEETANMHLQQAVKFEGWRVVEVEGEPNAIR